MNCLFGTSKRNDGRSLLPALSPNAGQARPNPAVSNSVARRRRYGTSQLTSEESQSHSHFSQAKALVCIPSSYSAGEAAPRVPSHAYGTTSIRIRLPDPYITACPVRASSSTTDSEPHLQHDHDTLDITNSFRTSPLHSSDVHDVRRRHRCRRRHGYTSPHTRGVSASETVCAAGRPHARKPNTFDAVCSWTAKTAAWCGL